ncbi:hypothetical protein MCERE19_01998 [Spirosomataceae bacterium]
MFLLAETDGTLILGIVYFGVMSKFYENNPYSLNLGLIISLKD